jgi:O-succinylbenzoate synthase
MRISSFGVFRYKLPLTEPLQMPRRQLYRREGLLLRLASDEGDVGWGEAVPLPGFSEERLQQATREAFKLKRITTGREIADDWFEEGNDFGHALGDLELSPSVHFALEQAAWMLAAETRAVPVHRLLADGDPHETLPLSRLLAGERGDILGCLDETKEDGYRAVKLKVGQDRSLDDDIQLTRALGERLGPGVALRLDANRAWSREEAHRFADGIAGVDVAYVEEPLAEPEGLPAFAEETGLPVALDETMRDVSLVTLEEHADYAEAAILKPTILGGFGGLVYFANKAADLGMRSVWSAAYEAGVAMMGLVALAACSRGDAAPLGADTYRCIEQDVIHPRLKLEGDASSIDVEEAVTVKRTLNGHLLREV